MSQKLAAETSLRAFCEWGRPRGPDGLTSRCETGEKFITFACRRKEEGEPVTSYETLTEACDWFLEAFRDYAEGKNGWAIYWRHKPTVEEEDGRWLIYARLVLVEIKETAK